MQDTDLSFPLILFSISQSMCWINDRQSSREKDHYGHSSSRVEPYFNTLFTFQIQRLRFQMARLLMRSRYSSKVISFSRPSEVFSSPQKMTSIYCSNLRMISFSSALILFFSTSILALTKSNSRVSSTVILYELGLQYMRNCARWKRFLLSAEFLSIVHFLYILTNSFSVIFLLRSSSNSHIILQIQVLPILMPIRLKVSLISYAVKYLCPCLADSCQNTLSRYFSSVELILNSSNFSSMVFSFSALRSLSFWRLKSNLESERWFSFSKIMEFLYFFWRCTGRSLYRIFFFYYFSIDYIINSGPISFKFHANRVHYHGVNSLLVNLIVIKFQQNKRMSEIRINRSADQIETALDQTLSQMHEHQKNGNYVEAENYRLTSEQLKRDLEARRIYEMEQRHNQQNNDLNRAHEDQLRNFNGFWDKKLSEFSQEGEKMVRDMEGRHQNQCDNLRAELEKQLSFKVKESSEFLNLKKMEEHMAKQKLYTEAHKVQTKLAELERVEKEAWFNARNLKIQTSINTLKAKQAAQLAALQKKIKTGLDEQTKDRNHQEARLNQKYANIEKELRGNHDKQVMAFRGQFRSKGGQGSPLLLNKSKLLSSSK